MSETSLCLNAVIHTETASIVLSRHISKLQDDPSSDTVIGKHEFKISIEGDERAEISLQEIDAIALKTALKHVFG